MTGTAEIAAEPERRGVRLVDWARWRRRCSLARCPPETAESLRDFAGARFRACCRRCAAPDVPVPAPAECWHRFETHLAAGRGRRGKRYKAWLFAWARGCDQPPAAALAFGATLLMRDVVRAYLAREAPDPRFRSLQAPLRPAGDGTLTAEDLLPAEETPFDEAADREFMEIADRQAARHWPDLDRRERVALAARGRGWPLDRPPVLRAARCGRSALHAAYRAALERLAARLRADYPAETSDALLVLARHTLGRLTVQAADWAGSERGCAALFGRRFRPIEPAPAPRPAAPEPVPAGRPGPSRSEPHAPTATRARRGRRMHRV